MKNVHYINAGAGSGKTYTLTKTLVELISNNECKPSEVILTTFTELAASEFRQKAYDALVKAKCYDKAAGLDSATIGTVHSVALKYVQKYWYILGLSSKMNVLSDDDKKVFISESVAKAIEPEDREVFRDFNETYTRKGYRNDDPWVQVLKNIIEQSETFSVESLEQSRDYSLEWVRKFFSGETVLPELEDVENWLAAYREICVKGDRNGNPYQNEIEKIDKIMENPLRFASLLDMSGMLQKPVRAAAREIPNTDKLINAVMCALHSEEAAGPLVRCIKTVFNLAMKVEKEFADYKAQNGLIEYNDMEKFFIQLLDNELVKEDIRSSVKYVFVDEFQDSNPIQIEIFEKLSELVKKSFWVGDPKQSIYGFRGSAPEIVMELTSRIRQGGDGFSYENLPYSWRSNEEIVKFDSYIAGKLFTDPDRYPDPELQHAPNGNNFKAEHPLQHWKLVDGITPEALSHQIMKVMETTGMQPKDIAILCRNNNDVIEYARWLKMYGLPVSSPETFLAEKAETQLVFAVLRYIMMADDHTKAELAMLIDEVPLDDIICKKDEVLKEFDEGRLMEVAMRVKHQSVPDIVDTVIDGLDLRGLCEKWGDAMNRHSNLDVLQAQAREYDNHCIQLGIGSSLSGYITYVSGMEIPPKANNSDNGVKVMTYHGSKGLEWRMVLMMNLNKDLLRNSVLQPRFIYNINIDKKDGRNMLRYIPDFRPTENNGVPAYIMEQPDIKAAYDEYVEKCCDENKRLLYVGFTRAKDYIVTMSTAKDKFGWLSGSGLEPYGDFKTIPLGKAHVWDAFGPESEVIEVTGIDRTKFVADAEKCTWYEPVVDLTARAPKNVSPSKCGEGVVSEIVRKVSIAEPLLARIPKNVEHSELGTCIHNCFAVCEGAAADAAKCERIVKNFGYSELLGDASRIAGSYAGICEFLEKEYGKAVAVHHELHYAQKMENGQRVVGEMDLVWETAGKHCVLLDFKNTFAKTDYAPQLHMYRKALESGGYTVEGVLIFYALQGSVAELVTKEA